MTDSKSFKRLLRRHFWTPKHLRKYLEDFGRLCCLNLSSKVSGDFITHWNLKNPTIKDDLNKISKSPTSPCCCLRWIGDSSYKPWKSSRPNKPNGLLGWYKFLAGFPTTNGQAVWFLDSPGQVVVFGPPLKDSSSDSDSESDTSSSSDESASSESSSEEAVDPASWLAKVVEIEVGVCFLGTGRKMRLNGVFHSWGRNLFEKIRSIQFIKMWSYQQKVTFLNEEGFWN